MERDIEVYDIAEFVSKALGLVERKQEFIMFVLCGLSDDRNVVLLDPLRNRLSDSRELVLTRDYDSILGIDEDVRVQAPLTLYVVGKPEDVLRQNIHITHSWGTNTVAVHKIPNICIGKWTVHSLLRVLIPGLYTERGNNSVSKEDLDIFYEKGFYPAMRALMGHRSEWPATVQAELFRARGVGGRLAVQTKEFPQHLVPQLGARIRRELAANGVSWGSTIVFLHQIRGTKNSTTHPVSVNAAQHAFHGFLQDNDLDFDDIIEHGKWWVDVGLQVSSVVGECLSWRTDSHRHIVQNVLRISEVQADKVTRVSSSKYTRDMTAHMPALSGCRIVPGARSEGPMQARYLQLYLTDKTATARKDGYHHAKFLKGKDILEKKSVEYLTNLYDLYTSSSQVIQSNARAEVRVPLEHFDHPFMGVNGPLLERSLVSVPKPSWWGLKAFRALGFQYLLDEMEKAPAKYRYRDEALLLAASAPWFLNSLHSTPDLGQASRDLLTAILPHIERVGADLDALPFLVSTRRRPGDSDTESDLDDEQSEDSDDSAAPRNVPPNANTVPAITQGLVFLREVRCGVDYPCPRFRAHPITIKDRTFVFIFGRDRDEIQQAMYANDMVQPANPNRVRNKVRRTTAYMPLHEERAIFHLRDQGCGLMNPPVDNLSDDEAQGEEAGVLVQENLPKDIDDELTKLWKQFLLDLTEKAPNMVSAGKPSYCILSPQDRLAVDETTYKNDLLSDYFMRCQWKIGTEEDFVYTFNNLWPCKGRAKYNAQNYRTCRYYIEWGHFLDMVPDPETEKKVRRALKKRFDELFWVPHAQADKIWWTKWDKNKPDLYHPTSGPQACPRILVRYEPQWEA